MAEIYTREDIDSLAEFGRDLVLKAREGDWGWFEGRFLEIFGGIVCRFYLAVGRYIQSILN